MDLSEQHQISQQLSGQSIGQSYQAESELKQFIAETFAHAYGAQIDHFCTRLMGVTNSEGDLIAAAGYNVAEDQTLFLEQYLNHPVEKVISAKLGFTVDRAAIAEVGNLATRHAGGARMLIRLVTEILHREGYRWVVFTATRSLINSFHRMGLEPVELAHATPNRVKNAAAWGSYYDTQPVVVVGDIEMGFKWLNAQS
ncbi:MAG: thermostable hemolysin [Limnobacter sp.]|nr:thermostable hemolysin [Limnobacter sp.]